MSEEMPSQIREQFEYTIYYSCGTPAVFLLDNNHEVIYHFGEHKFDLIQNEYVDVCMFDYDEDNDVTMFHRHNIIN